jgi:hypothetical protein
MKLARARKILKKHCTLHEEWSCGLLKVFLTGRDQNPRFDRQLEIYLDLKPYSVDIDKISSLLKLLDKLGKPIKPFFQNKKRYASLSKINRKDQQ